MSRQGLSYGTIPVLLESKPEHKLAALYIKVLCLVWATEWTMLSLEYWLNSVIDLNARFFLLSSSYFLLRRCFRGFRRCYSYFFFNKMNGGNFLCICNILMSQISIWPPVGHVYSNCLLILMFLATGFIDIFILLF